MKLTKGKITKLYNKKNQSVKKKNNELPGVLIGKAFII